MVAILSERHRVKTLTKLVQVEPGDSTEETQEGLSSIIEELSDNSDIKKPPINVTEVDVIVESTDIITIATLENEWKNIDIVNVVQSVLIDT